MLVDPQVGAGDGGSHRVEADVAVAVHDGDTAALGLPVDLLEVDADRVEELEDVRAQCRACGVRAPDARQAELLAHGAQGDEVREGDLHPQRASEPTAPATAHGRGSPADVESPAQRPALEPAAVTEADLQLTENALPDRRRGEQQAWPDLAQVGLHGGGRLGEVQRERGLQRARDGDHLLADPGQRQEAEELVLAVDRVLGHEARPHAQQVRVGEHRQLWPAGRAGGRAEDRDVLGPTLLHLLLPPARRPLRAAALDLGELDQVRLLVALEPARVVVDDLLDGADGGALHELHELVDLLLVGGDDEAHLRLAEDAFELLDGAVGIEPERAAAERLRGELGDQPLRAVVAQHREGLAAPEAERGEPLGEAAHASLVFRPAGRLPDAVALLAQRVAVRVLGCEPAQQPRERVVGAHAGCGALVVCGSPR